MNNNTVPTHSVVDPRRGSQTPPCWLQWKTNHFLYIEDITRWREDMNFIFEWQNNILRTSAASE